MKALQSEANSSCCPHLQLDYNVADAEGGGCWGCGSQGMRIKFGFSCIQFDFISFTITN